MNAADSSHTFTVAVKKDAGDGSGFVAASGVTVSPSESGVGALQGTGTCETGTTDSSGQCTIVVNSSTSGSSTVDASATVTVGGVDIDVATDGYGANTVDNVKTWVAGSLVWHKVDNLGAPLAGATFEVCETHALDTATDTYVDITDDCFTVLDNDATDENPADGEFLVSGLELGRYTVQETAAPTGYTIVNPNAVQAPDMTVTDPDVEITEAFVNTPPLQGCTPGWWKNNGLTAWDEPTDQLATDLAAAVLTKWGATVDGTTESLFREVFNLTAGEMQGLDPDLTLLQAVELGGGGFSALARQGTSALLNSLSVDYAFTTDQVLQEVHDAFLSGDVGTLVGDYDTANNRDHSACPTGQSTSAGLSGGLLFVALLPLLVPRVRRHLRRKGRYLERGID